MIEKLLKFSCAVLVVGFLFAQHAWAAPAKDDLTMPSKFAYFVPAPLEPQLSSDGNALYNGGPPVVYVDNPNPSYVPLRIPAPIDLLNLLESATATFSITYVADGGTDPWGETCYTFPDKAKTAFEAAANIWTNILQSSVPITISACWADLGSNITLGYSGGGPLRRNFTGAPLANTWYKGSLANALAGSDLDPTKSDMYITYNRNFPWYYGTDANPPSTQYDLVSVVLHEIAHGLNFTGSMAYSGGQGSWGYGTSPASPNIYDTFMRDGSGNQLTDTAVYANPSTDLGSALTSNDIWFHGSNAMVANGGQAVKIYAPSTWSSGSSYSHLDYNTFNNTSNQLMVYSVSKGESVHDPGHITKGILKDLGWNISAGPICIPSDGLWSIDEGNPGDSGRGFQLELEDNVMVFTYYGYNADGTAQWYLAAGTFENGSFSASMWRYEGGTYLGGPYRAASPIESAGTVSITFSSSTTGTITLPNEQPKGISKYIWGSTPTIPNPPSDGLWSIDEGNPGDSGRGFQLELEDNVMVFTYYGYNVDGTAQWYLAASTFENGSFSAPMWRYEGGTYLGGPYHAASPIESVGTVSITFSSSTTGTIILPNEQPKGISKYLW